MHESGDSLTAVETSRERQTQRSYLLCPFGGDYDGRFFRMQLSTDERHMMTTLHAISRKGAL